MPKLEALLDSDQLEAIENLDNGKILHGGVGVGKTRTLAGYYVAKEVPRWREMMAKKGFNGEAHRVEVKNSLGPDVYVITTARKRDLGDWEEEFAYFGIGTHRDATLGGVVNVDSWNNLKNYKDVKDAFFIFDEQRLVGSGTWVKSFIKIAKNNRWVMASATPGDTWMDYIPVFVANGFYRNRTEFKEKHVIYEWQRYGKYPIIKGFLNEYKLESLRNLLLVEMTFHRHTTRHLIWLTDIDGVGYDKLWYDKVAYNRWNPFENVPVKDAGEKWRLLRRICNQDPSRLNKIREILVDHPRLLIFYNFDYELNILLDLAGEVPTYQYNGHVHDPLPEGDKWVYLCQYVAAAEAWDCITTDTTVMYSMPDSYKNFEQAQGRTDRRNTPFVDLFYYIFVSNTPRDKANKASLDAKKDFNEPRFVREMEILEVQSELWEETRLA